MTREDCSPHRPVRRPAEGVGAGQCEERRADRQAAKQAGISAQRARNLRLGEPSPPRSTGCSKKVRDVDRPVAQRRSSGAGIRWRRSCPPRATARWTARSPVSPRTFLEFCAALKIQSRDYGLIQFNLLGSQLYILDEWQRASTRASPRSSY